MIKTNKEKTLIVADKEIPVNFEINYFFKFFKDKTGIDLLRGKIDIDDTDTISVFEWLSLLIYAGNNAYQKLHKTGDPLTADDAQDLVFTLTPAAGLELLMETISTIKGDDEKNATPQATKKKLR
jgi:hypothetical protein